MNHWSDSLVNITACEGAVDWCRTQPDPDTAWAACERADWMLWLAGRLSGPAGDPRRVTLALACADCTDTVPQSPGGAECLRVLRAWASGEATIQCVRTAAAAAASANDDDYADAAAYAASSAAYAAAAAAAYADAADDAAASADDAWPAAKTAHLKSMCEIVRRHYPAAPVIPEAEIHSGSET